MSEMSQYARGPTGRSDFYWYVSDMPRISIFVQPLFLQIFRCTLSLLKFPIFENETPCLHSRFLAIPFFHNFHSRTGSCHKCPNNKKGRVIFVPIPRAGMSQMSQYHVSAVPAARHFCPSCASDLSPQHVRSVPAARHFCPNDPAFFAASCGFFAR